MPRSFLTSAVSPSQQSADNGAFLAGLHIGAVAQGNYEQNQAAQAAAEAAAKHAMEVAQLKEQGDTYRRLLENTKDLAKSGFEKSMSDLNDQEKFLRDQLTDSTGRLSDTQRNQAATDLTNIQNQKKTLLTRYSQIDPSATSLNLPAPGQSYNPADYSGQTPEFQQGVKGKLAQDVAKGIIEGGHANDVQQNINRFGFSGLQPAIEYKYGLPLPLISQNQAQAFKLATNGTKVDKDAGKLEAEAPGALGNYFQYVNDDQGWQQALKDNPIKPRSQFEAPDTREQQYHAHIARGKEVQDKYVPAYQKNFALQVGSNPALANVMQQIQSNPDNAGIDWSHPSRSKQVAAYVARRIGEAAQAKNTELAGQLLQGYNKLGLNYWGTPGTFFGK